MYMWTHNIQVYRGSFLFQSEGGVCIRVLCQGSVGERQAGKSRRVCKISTVYRGLG